MINVNNQFQLSFFTEYYQFYILDAETKAQTDSEDFWNVAANIRKLAIGEGILGVSVAKYATIKVELNIFLEEPVVNNHADHIVQSDINLPSGILKVQSCTSFQTQLELSLEKGAYTVRVSSFNLSTVVGDEGDDYYVVEIWRTLIEGTKVLKVWQA